MHGKTSALQALTGCIITFHFGKVSNKLILVSMKSLSAHHTTISMVKIGKIYELPKISHIVSLRNIQLDEDELCFVLDILGI